MINKQLHYIGNDTFEIKSSEKDFILDSNELFLKVDACGVCGSDFGYTSVSNHTRENSIVLGHEIIGTVLKIGNQVKNFNVGSQVVVNPGLNCGICEHCKRGNPNLCTYTKFFGYPPFDGGFQQYIVLPEAVCYSIPPTLDCLSAVLVEPLAVSLHSLNLSKFRHGMSTLIIGAGAIGITLLKLLKNYSSGTIFVSEPVEYRRNLAKKLGADVIINPLVDNMSNIVLEYTNGHGVDRIFEASGSDDILPLIIEVSKNGAQIMLIGIPKDDIVSFCHSESRKKGLTIKMVRTINNTMDAAIEILSNDPSYKELVNCTFTLEDTANCFKQMKNYETNSIKNLILCN